MSQEYYKHLSLPPIPNNYNNNKEKLEKPRDQQTEYESQLRHFITLLDNDELQRKLRTTIDKLIMSWSAKHDALIDTLVSLEQSKKSLERKLSSQSLQCKKAQRDANVYRTRYEHYMLQRRSSTNSNTSQHHQQPQGLDYQRRKASLASSTASCLSGNSYNTTNSSSSIRSSSSSTYTHFSHLTDTVEYAASSAAASITYFEDEESEDNQSIDFLSVLSDQDSLTLPLEVSPNNLAAPATHPTSPYNHKKQHREIDAAADERPSSASSEFRFDCSSDMPSDENVLKFGCGDGFWNTIAKSKNDKAEVDELISKYLQRGGNPNVAKNSETVKNVKEGYGLIHAVVAVKNTAALQKILDAGAKTNVYPLTTKLADKIHPLVLAAKLGYMTGVRLLIERGGAHVLKNRGPMGESVLHAAVQSDSDEMVAYLLRVSQNNLLERTDDQGATPLHYACISGRTRLIEFFIRDCQAQCDPQDLKGETPLHYAVRHRRSKVAMKLVGDLGVYPSPCIHKQVPTPLDLAKSGGLKSMSEYLRQMGAKTSKEVEKASKIASIQSSRGSVMSGGSNSSGSSGSSGTESATGQSTTSLGVRHFLHTKTSQILRGSF